MTLTPYFQFGSISAVESANFPLSRGVSPSVCTISILPGVELDRVPRTMTFGDGVRSVSFSQCVIVDVSPQIDRSGFMSLTVSIHDRRWKWRFGQISGTYNVRRAGRLVESTEQSPRELAKLCFAAMGEKKFDISRMPNDTNPYVDWDLERPDAALDQLCQAVNAHVVLRSDDVAAIYPDGFGTDLPKIPSSSLSEAFEFGVIPGAVGITTSPFAWQFDFKLEPVGLDTDGSIVPIQQLSFTPKTEHGWYDSNPPEFAGLKQGVRKLAQATVFKWYRIVPPSGKMPIANMEIESIKQFLPLLENQLEYAKLSVEERALSNKVRMLDSDRTRLPAQVFGVFYDEEGTGSDNVEEFAINTIKQPKLIFGKSFSIDNQRGLVKFADPVIRYNPRSGTLGKDGKRQQELVNPDIRLRTATNFRHPDSGAAYRWHRKVAINGGLDKTIIAWEAREDITPQWRVDRVKGTAINNITEVERQLNYYLSFAQKRHEPKRPASGSYPWLVPYSPDGRIAQVIYEIDSEGFIGTSIHRDIEALLNIQSYQERRREVARLATQQRDARSLTKQDETKDKS